MTTVRSRLYARARIPILAIALILAGTATRAEARDDDLAAAQAAVDAASGLHERRAALDALLEVRARLLHQRGDDPEAIFWALDQASDLVFELFPLGGADLAIFAGMPTGEQLDRAQRIADETPRRLDFAERRLDDTVDRLENDPNFSADEELQAQRRRLVMEERDLRIPLLRGLAAAIAAESRAARGAPAAAAAREVEIRLDPIEARLSSGLRALAFWMHAAALLHLGQVDEAIEVLERVEAEPDALEADRFAARMIGVRAVALRDGDASAEQALDAIDASYRAPDQLFYRFLIADRRCAIRLRQAARTPAAERGDAVRHAIDAYRDLERTAAGAISADALRELVLERLRLAPLEGVPLEALPAVVTLARARAMSGEETRRDEALEILEAALGRSRLSEVDRAALEFERAETLQRLGRDMDAASAYLAIARAGDVRADTAIERAARLATRDGTDLELQTTILDRILAHHEHIPSVDRWRYARGRIELELGHPAEAIALFDSVRDDAATAPDARYMAAVAASRLVEDRGLDASWDDRTAAIGAARRAVLRAEAEPDVSRGADMLFYASMARVLEAEVESDRAEHEAVLEALDGIPPGGLDDDAVLIRATRVRVAALRERGDAAGVDAALRAVIERTGDRAGPVLEGVLVATMEEIDRLERNASDPDRAELLRRGLVPLARRLDTWLSEQGADVAHRDHLLRRAADGYRIGAAHDEALGLYDELRARHGDAEEVLFGRAEALFGLGGEERLGEAMAIYRRLGRATTDGDAFYWPSQLRILQILDRVGRHTDQIRPRIDRLRLEDPRFGGAPWERQFGVLEQRYR